MLRCEKGYGTVNQLQVFGVVGLVDPHGTSIRAALAQPKRLALLIYLAVARPQGLHRRDKLLSLFWPGSETKNARAALSTSLTFLRKTVDREVILTRGYEEVGVDPILLTSDVRSFHEALDRGDLSTAVELYTGPFLDGFHPRASKRFEDWRHAEARRLDQRAERALEILANEAEAQGRAVDAIQENAIQVGKEHLDLRSSPGANSLESGSHGERWS